MNRFELYYVNLDPTEGAEINKTRPCLIISPDEMNRHAQTVIIIPLTTQERNIPSRVRIAATALSGLKNDSFAALDHIKSIDKRRCLSYVGRISEEESQEMCDVLCTMFQY